MKGTSEKKVLQKTTTSDRNQRGKFLWNGSLLVLKLRRLRSLLTTYHKTGILAI